MDDVRSWLVTVDTMQPPADLWAVATERAERVADVPLHRSGRGSRMTPPGAPTGWRRVAIVVVALALFALAGAFAWRIIHRSLGVPAGPPPSGQADPFSSLAPRMIPARRPTGTSMLCRDSVDRF